MSQVCFVSLRTLFSTVCVMKSGKTGICTDITGKPQCKLPNIQGGLCQGNGSVMVSHFVLCRRPVHNPDNTSAVSWHPRAPGSSLLTIKANCHRQFSHSCSHSHSYNHKRHNRNHSNSSHHRLCPPVLAMVKTIPTSGTGGSPTTLIGFGGAGSKADPVLQCLHTARLAVLAWRGGVVWCGVACCGCVALRCASVSPYLATQLTF